MNKKVTIQNIADKLGISKSTVSKAISGATDINENTRENIIRCAAEMGYVINYDKMSKSKSVAVLVCNVYYENAEQFGYEVIAGIQTAAAEQGLSVNIISVTKEQATLGNYDTLVIGKRFEGIFFLGFRPHVDFISRNKGYDVPFIVFDDYIDSPLTARVGCENGIHLVVLHLWKKGHRKIGFIGGESDSMVTVERKKLFCETVESLGGGNCKDLVRYASFSGDGVKEAALDIAGKGSTAIVCVSDVIASAAVRELTKAGYSVPADISVTGYDNLPIAEYCVPPLTTVDQNCIHIGKAAFMTMQQIKSGIRISTVLLHTRLVERDSVADITQNT